jgi:hypothetical protein
MANTELSDLIPFLLISASIYFLLNFLIFKYLTTSEKWNTLFHTVMYIGITYFLTQGFLQNDPWAQIIWMLGFFIHNGITWIILIAKFFTLRKRKNT